MNDVYISSAAFRTTSTREMVSMALRYGITHLELTSSLAHSEELLNPIRSTRERISYSVHHNFPTPRQEFKFNLASTDSDERHRSVELVESAIRLSTILGAKCYSVGAGNVINPKLVESPNTNRLQLPQPTIDQAYEDAWNYFIESLQSLNDTAKEWNMQLLVENNYITTAQLRAGLKNAYLLTRADEFERLKRDIPDDNLGFMVNLAHLEITANALYFNKFFFLERVRSHIYGLRMSDNDGTRDTNEVITPTSWFVPLLKTFPDVPMVVEVKDLAPDVIQQQLEMVRRFRKHGTGRLIDRDE